MSELFKRKNAASENARKSEQQTARLQRKVKVGQLVIEKGIPRKKKCVQLGIDLSEFHWGRSIRSTCFLFSPSIYPCNFCQYTVKCSNATSYVDSSTD